MSPYDLTPDDLQEHLREHVAWLEESMRGYDAGKVHESKRLAHTLRNLLHDTTRSHSLLEQLRVRNTLRYWSMLRDFGPSPPKQLMGIGLELGFRDGAPFSRYRANLDSPTQKLPFAKWWQSEALIVQDGQVITRRRAVLALANKDGGSHVDPELTELERKLLRTDAMGWTMITITGAKETIVREDRINLGGVEGVVRATRLEGGQVSEERSDLTSPVQAIVRQAAHELHGTLREQISSLAT